MADTASYVMSEELRITDEVQRKNNFTLILNPPSKAGISADVLRLSIHKAEVPKRTITEIGIDFVNEKYFVAGKPTHEDATITVTDVIDMQTAAMIDTWCSSVYDPTTGIIGRASDYKGTGQLVMMDPTGNFSGGKSWQLVGVWPKSVNYGGGDMTATGDGAMNMIEITFKVDKVIFQPGGPNSSGKKGF